MYTWFLHFDRNEIFVSMYKIANSHTVGIFSFGQHLTVEKFVKFMALFKRLLLTLKPKNNSGFLNWGKTTRENSRTPNATRDFGEFSLNIR